MAMLCSCHAVPERHIARAIDRGARCVAEVAEACWAGSNCGGCHDAIDEMISARCRATSPSTTLSNTRSTRVAVSVA